MDKKSLKDCFSHTALQQGEKKAISFLRQGMIETEISYRELNQDSNRMANTLLDLGVKKGDRVVLYLPKSLVLVAAHLALQKIGAMSVPLNPGFTKSEMAYLLGDADATTVFSGTAQESIIKKIDPQLKTIDVDTERSYQELDFFRSASDKIPEVEIDQNDPGLIIYTSGTTGKPKGAILTHNNLVHDSRNIIKSRRTHSSNINGIKIFITSV